jgi:hypothetical protein
LVLTRSRLFFGGDAVVDEDDDPGDGTNATSAREHDDDDDLEGVVAQVTFFTMTSMAAGSKMNKAASDISCEASGGSSSHGHETSSSKCNISSKSMECKSNDINNEVVARMQVGFGHYSGCKTGAQQISQPVRTQSA